MFPKETNMRFEFQDAQKYPCLLLSIGRTFLRKPEQTNHTKDHERSVRSKTSLKVPLLIRGFKPTLFQRSNRVLVGWSRGTRDAPPIAGGHAGPPLQRLSVLLIEQRIEIGISRVFGYLNQMASASFSTKWSSS
jgi:hypothetical protein